MKKAAATQTTHVQISHDLTQTELELLSSLVAGPLYTALKKIMNTGIHTWTEELYQSKDSSQMFVLQGRIQGARYLQNVPALLAKMQKDQATKPKAPENPL